MTIDDLLKRLGDMYGARILKVERRSAQRGYVDIYPKDIVEMTRFLFKELELRFIIASAVDDFDAMEILYHFSLDGAGIILSLRVLLRDRHDPRVDTITTVTRSAWWIEREMHELFGISFDGNTDLRPLLLPDDWPKGVYPLRKDFIVPKRDSRNSSHKPQKEAA